MEKIFISPGVWKRAQLNEPQREDVCTIQLVQYATWFGVIGSAAGMAWLALVRGRHLGRTYMY